MHVAKRIRRSLLRRLLPPPAAVRHAEYSMLLSADDELSKPSPTLLTLSLDAVAYARETSLADVSARIAGPFKPSDVWPGELYKLLAGLVRAVQPACVLEVGTGGGTSALTIKKFLAPHAKLLTFDLVDWREIEDTLLREEDFQDGRLVAYRDDLSDPAVFETYRALVERADFLFLDAAKDGRMEQRLLDLLRTASFKTAPLVVFDDIRLWNMLKIWRAIPFPKLDLTSFGHWTGTGLVEWDGSSP
ncbi:MAG: methyltransferase [Candidatus Omnitrophica bacterium]|nr:methyltransferase [Candidatus Omnitrophota bacterium]